MPLRPVNRGQAPTEGRESRWNRTRLLPPTLDDLLPEVHPARFAAVFVDALDCDAWAGMKIDVGGHAPVVLSGTVTEPELDS